MRSTVAVAGHRLTALSEGLDDPLVGHPHATLMSRASGYRAQVAGSQLFHGFNSAGRRLFDYLVFDPIEEIERDRIARFSVQNDRGQKSSFTGTLLEPQPGQGAAFEVPPVLRAQLDADQLAPGGHAKRKDAFGQRTDPRIAGFRRGLDDTSEAEIVRPVVFFEPRPSGNPSQVDAPPPHLVCGAAPTAGTPSPGRCAAANRASKRHSSRARSGPGVTIQATRTKKL